METIQPAMPQCSALGILQGLFVGFSKINTAIKLHYYCSLWAIPPRRVPPCWFLVWPVVL